MSAFATALMQAQQLSALEATSVLLGVLYLVLVIRENVWCWPAAFFSAVLAAIVVFRVRLYAQVPLNAFYAVMAVYGWYQWRHGGRKRTDGELPISVWPFRTHAVAIGGSVALGAVGGWLLSEYTAAAFPYFDSFVAVASVVTTYMVARKVLENWLYWIVVDGLALYLYWQRELYLFVGLFALYLVLVVVGLVRWHRDWRARAAVPA